MAVIAAGLTSQNGYHSNTGRGLSVAMATADSLRCGLPWFLGCRGGGGMGGVEPHLDWEDGERAESQDFLNSPQIHQHTGLCVPLQLRHG